MTRQFLVVAAITVLLPVIVFLAWISVARPGGGPAGPAAPQRKGQSMIPPRNDAAVDVTVTRHTRPSRPATSGPEPSQDLLALLEEPMRPAVLVESDVRPGGRTHRSQATETRSQWLTGSRSHRGYRREDNEDAVLTLPGLVAVADGVGGGPAGGIASRIVLRTLQDALGTNPDEEADLRTAVLQAGAALYGATLVEKAMRGMATTLDVVVLGEPDAGLAVAHGAHVGDAAVWLIRKGRAAQLLTKPHLSAGGALTHAVGGSLHVYCELWKAEVGVGDRLVLTTDGFHGQLSSGAIADEFDGIRRMPPADAADALVDAALREGGRDNVSAVVTDLAPVGRARPTVRPAGRLRRLVRRRPIGPAGPGSGDSGVAY